MYWVDGSIYRGYWENGVQCGIGIMIFKDGLRKAGFFKENIYESPLTTLEEYTNYIQGLGSKDKVPESFRQEIKEYIGQLQQNNQDDEDFLGRELNENEMEDTMFSNALQ